MGLLFRPASDFGLSLRGAGWRDSPYRQWYRGVLLLQDICFLYSSVRVVLALAESRQKKRGVINNRIYVGLAAGSIILSDPYPYLEQQELGSYLNFAST